MANPLPWLDSATSLLGSAYNLFQNERAFKYNKDMAKLTMEREDTAVQRRVNDLIAAGLSPTLAAGDGASSSSHTVAGSAISAGGVLDKFVAQAQIDNMRRTNELLQEQERAQRISNDIAEVTKPDAIKAVQENAKITEANANSAVSAAVVNKINEQNAVELGMTNENLSNPIRSVANAMSRTSQNISKAGKAFNDWRKSEERWWNKPKKGGKNK